jgi:hypothetical protein
MLGRSLARGEGFTLPVRVRHDEAGPVRHDARGERAPLFPVFLAGLERLGVDDGRGAIVPALQCANALVGVLDALLVAALAFALAAGTPSPASGGGVGWGPWAALAAGLLAAWSPPLTAASTKLLAEPLGLAFILLALRCEIAAPSPWLALASGLALGLARLARPEAAIALVLVLALRLLGERRSLALLVLAGAAIPAVFWLSSPQGFILRVNNFRDVMFDHGSVRGPAPSALAFVLDHPGAVIHHVFWNLVDLLRFALQYGGAVPVLAALALVRGSRGEKTLVATGLALFLGVACVWATRDHQRFLVAPLALFAGPAVLEAERLLRQAPLRLRQPLLALAIVGALLPLAIKQKNEAASAFHRSPEESTWQGTELEAIARRLRALPEGAAFSAVAPWGLSLASGRDGLLLPIRLEPAALRAFLARSSEVGAVVLRPGIRFDDATPEPLAYEATLAAIGSAEDVGGARVFFLPQTSSKK